MKEMNHPSLSHSELAKNPEDKNGEHGSFVPQDDGKIEHRDILEDWVDHIISFV